MLIIFQYQLSNPLWLRLGQTLKGFFRGAIRFYQLFISPLKQPSCRFYPTCSSYSMQAFERYGVFRGMYLTLKRLFKCHPFHRGGYDPLP